MNIDDLRASPTNLPRIGADNLFRQGTITASSGTGRYAVDWRADRVWTPDAGTETLTVVLATATDADYLFLAFHNLADISGSIKLERWTGSAWATVVAAISPTDNEPVWRSFDADPATQWRVTVTGTSQPVIGVLSIGVAIELQEGIQPGWTPPQYAHDDDVIDSVSEDGVLIGRTILRRPAKTRLSTVDISDDWMRTYWRPNRERLIRLPWGLCWSPETADGGAALAWTDGVPQPDSYSRPGFQRIQWDLRMIFERDVSTADTVNESCPDCFPGFLTLDPSTVTVPLYLSIENAEHRVET